MQNSKSQSSRNLKENERIKNLDLKDFDSTKITKDF